METGKGDWVGEGGGEGKWGQVVRHLVLIFNLGGGGSLCASPLAILTAGIRWL